jgi:exodeoxyribonuclease V beta subunit
MKALNPHTLPLRGRQVIEASAGTGKTWTLAALYLRLVLGHERSEALLPPQILVMTFTDAATAELRERIRTRLSQAATYFDLSAQGHKLPPSLKVDAFLETLRDSFDASLWPRCALQLNCAAEWMDDAAIYTIHGWSRRMLTQHALESHNLFEQTRLENANQLKLTLVQDYWREWFYPLSGDTLQHITPLIGQDPAKFLNTLNEMWKAQERKPRDKNAGDEVAPHITPKQAIHTHMVWQEQVEAAACAAREAWRDDVLQALQAAGAQKKIKGLRVEFFTNWLTVLQAWCTQGTKTITSKEEFKVLERFTTQALQDKGWHEAEGFSFFAAMQTYVKLFEIRPETDRLIALHAADAVGQAYKTAKTQRAAFDFSDLLQNLRNAVMADDGRLATAIRQQYPVALVDEFQDTDPWQYGSLNRIYDPDACNDANALVMIGDPKQAIYSFRGADLGTYLLARKDALKHNKDALHTLTGNHRSSEGLVKAVNHVFMQSAQPFASSQGEIEFVEVSAQGHEPALMVNGIEPPPFTVWQMHPLGNNEGRTEGDSHVVSSASYLNHTANVFADQMADLLNQGAATPGDMAVLVRSQKQADAMRHALRVRHIPSVYLSDHTSVYQSTEATDLWRLLRAVASPRQTNWVRAAVGSHLWALDLQGVLTITQDEAQWEQLLEQFHQWHTLWQQHGVLPMLHQWLHSQHVAQRMLAEPEGERRLSNLLHLGELLQHAAQSLQGEHALVRFLGEKIQSQHHDSDAQQARLETDALCVKVITYHKSKGLQYPLVFVPFAGAFGVEKKPKTHFAQEEKTDDTEDDNDPTATSVEEDMRLLYVALTRAQRGLWIGVAETQRDLTKATAKTELKRSALSLLLQREVRGDLSQQLHNLWGTCASIQVAALPQLQGIRYQAPAAISVPKDALTPQRSHHSLWWTASFSAITRGLVSESKRDEAVADAITDASTDPIPQAQTHAAATPALPVAEPDSNSAWQSFPAGARYGTLLHDLLEWLSQNQWPVANTQAPEWAQHAWGQLLERKASWLQLGDAPRSQLAPWLQTVVQTPLPLSELNATPLTLRDLSTEQLWPEMEFNLEVHQVSASKLDKLIQSHVFEGTPRPALQARVMQGMLTGSMDLVLQHDGRYWVVDYKSNKLPSYDSATLQDAVLHKRYDVQYVLYTLALHRLLKVRLPGFDYAQHMGGAVYMFLRGIDAAGAGVHLLRPPQALIETLDACFEKGTL